MITVAPVVVDAVAAVRDITVDEVGGDVEDGVAIVSVMLTDTKSKHKEMPMIREPLLQHEAWQ